MRGPPGNGAVGGHRAAHALNAAVAEFLLVFGELLGVVIAHEAGDGGTGTGEDADDVADEPTADDRGGQPLLFLPGQANFVGELRDLGPLLDLGLHENEDLRHGEQADKGAGGVDAFGKERLAEHEALGTENGGKTDGRQQQAQRTGHEALDHGLAGNARDDSQAEQAQPEVFGGHELQRQLGQHGGKEIQGNAAEKTAPERAPAGGQAQSQSQRKKGSKNSFHTKSPLHFLGTAKSRPLLRNLRILRRERCQEKTSQKFYEYNVNIHNSTIFNC